MGGGEYWAGTYLFVLVFFPPTQKAGKGRKKREMFWLSPNGCLLVLSTGRCVLYVSTIAATGYNKRALFRGRLLSVVGPLIGLDVVVFS